MARKRQQSVSTLQQIRKRALLRLLQQRKASRHLLCQMTLADVSLYLQQLVFFQSQ